MSKIDVTFEQVEELMKMLTGEELPEGMIMASQPKLSRVQAFSIIWFLQEHLHILPDNFEMCAVCGELFDTHYGGFIVDGSAAPDSWHEDHGVTQEALERNDGAKFCSESCEHCFWVRHGKG